eukprot:jgi/Psemu1/58610/gm1.58610_g
MISKGGEAYKEKTLGVKRVQMKRHAVNYCTPLDADAHPVMSTDGIEFHGSIECHAGDYGDQQHEDD